MAELWQQEAERLGGAALAQVLTELRDAQRRMIEVVEGLKSRDADDRAAIDKIMAGFPANDFDGHRRYHESVIEWRELRNKIARECLSKIAQATIFGALGWLGVLLWKTFVITVKQ